MSKTTIGTSINQPFVGYMVNVELSDENKQKVAEVQDQLTQKFGKAIWHQPSHSLHITLFDWLAPFVDYGEDKDVLYKKIFDEYDKAVSQALKNMQLITVKFNEIQAAPAAIFGVGKDHGEFTKIRQHFLDNVELLPNTKLPPTIIHFTISRFLKEIELGVVQEFVKGLDFSITEHITAFRLVREEIDPMLKFKVTKEYLLA